ncbi:MAG: hypothetical protein AAB209_00235 [Bacteroidota bacterium]
MQRESTLVSQKLEELQLENEFFQKKYGMSFSEFESSLKSMSEEKFDMEDDYLAWKFAYDCVKYFQSHIESQTPNQKLEP